VWTGRAGGLLDLVRVWSRQSACQGLTSACAKGVNTHNLESADGSQATLNQLYNKEPEHES